ncbi:MULTISPECIES: lysine biosynthesis protein LysW [Dethiosulfovibrio]|jgi:alpha-aminoadipate carrier protein LysW|uniref:Lysine biosynthesis protein LysW n=3 Tax=Dethiosulfovibrio TaxID=47054 RepID=D2Z853_9BACT|nr:MULTISPECIES: lysine biosynthesis protein LysW [Dethiosulfovibrio]MEA3284322.1 lysine biosynthesis protein LysW [Synergistota bacterium]EFC91650.1 lysine biosynthesis protein LysW [Dethiosulfovibrio peptidovorans DSM 11002]MCF4114394.1 lysine biosynthesis protein LysW [Dethiosulfovibrio russensis]MCF4142945.1 lysine biosynthesis protein LysW [Dethiosulfovibrio marinus]MCF4145042.1 lysine biosynthesis protein LysW [Dethiosulfovibrio acidaminovorans]
MKVSCVVCEGSVALPDDAMIGELLICDDCGTELELVSLDPLKVEEAPEIQEDWGE